MTPTTTVLAAAPLDPDPDEARRLLLRELTGRDYVAAQPTWLDRAADSFWNWLNGIRFGGVEGAPAVALVVLLIVVVVVLVVVLAVYGVPRLNRRSSRGPELFDQGDDRDSDRLRRAAADAAAAGDLVLAVTESFRALARGLVERDVLSTTPGTTARTVGDQAGRVFPDLAGRLASAAESFDGVRYLDRPGSEAAWRDISALDRELEQLTPVAAS